MILGIALILFFVIEAGLSIAFKMRSFWRPPETNFRKLADTYPDRSWSEKYYSEIDDIEKNRSLRWRPYVYWRRLPRNGEYINIDNNGLRKTINPVAADGGKSPVKVFVFGGSTIWGLGSSDADTIPSQISNELNKNGVNCEVVNFGQYAYVSTQSVIELMLQLQKGNIPDAVIFYDGVNDTFNAFQTNTPGLTHNEVNRELEYGLLDKGNLKTYAAQSIIRQLSTVRFLGGFLKQFGGKHEQFQPIPLKYEQSISDKKALAAAVVETYFNNIRMVQALAKSYGFTAQFYWQPVIFTKKQLSDYELRSIEMDFYFPGMKEFYLDTYDRLKDRSAGLAGDLEFFDISSTFNDIEEPIYVDFNHMGAKGNRVIAQRMTHEYLKLKKVGKM